MSTNYLWKTSRILVAICLVAGGLGEAVNADDTEIYHATFGRPKVLIIFDDSGSMRTPLEGGQTRLQIAQNVVSQMVQDNTSIDFGLALFNHNSDGRLGNTDGDHGGRIVQRILTTTDVDARDGHRQELLDLVDATNADGGTPLCESTYEVYQYLSGGPVTYGDKRDATTGGDPSIDLPPRDTDAEDGDNYISPETECSNTYVILMTDGFAQFDSNANEAIEFRTGETCEDYITDLTDGHGGFIAEKNCLPVLTNYMATSDLDRDPNNGDQFAITYTIGFATDQELLRDAATAENGYFTADNASELTAAFQGAITDILESETTFTSPAVAVDTFSRTESRNDVYFAMFEPTKGVDWPGNIKKLNLFLDDDGAELRDANNRGAIDPVSGQILADATTIWSETVGDGPTVTKGGVGELLQARAPATRVLYTNTGPADALQAFDPNNIDADAYSFDDASDLYALFGVDDRAELDALIFWAMGYTVPADYPTTDIDADQASARGWILSDMLHSKPLVVNYGALNPNGGSTFTEDNPDLRILVGTNGGFLHMFGNVDGEEDWAFFPKELGAVLAPRKDNLPSVQHVYGVDASPVVYTRDQNMDGTIDVDDGDKAWLYMGLRRGGRILYAVDISNPDAPETMWQVTGDPNDPDYDSGFAELGQTWSDPVVTRIPGYKDDTGQYKPVLVFGAGYDPVMDDSGLATATAPTVTMGRGLYIVDAENGDLVWSVTWAADAAPDTATNMPVPALSYPIAGGTTVLDSLGDGLSDRIYFADTGGGVWRIDLPGDTLPDASQDSWHITQVANLNGSTEATDRRFFNTPDIARAQGDTNFDAILIGSGDRTNPNATDVINRFYMIRDERVTPYFTAAPTQAQCEAEQPIEDFRCALPVTDSDLFDATNNVLQVGSAQEIEDALADLAELRGWFIDLKASGEKSLARSITIFGKVFFTSFSPDTSLTSLCDPEPGDGRLYVVDLFNAGALQDFDDDGDYERSWVIGGLIPDTPSPHFGSDGEIRLLLPPGSGGEGEISNPFLPGVSLPNPYGSYWFQEEY